MKLSNLLVTLTLTVVIMLPILLLDSCKEEIPLTHSFKGCVTHVKDSYVILDNDYEAAPFGLSFLDIGDSVSVHYYKGHLLKERIIYCNKLELLQKRIK